MEYRIAKAWRIFVIIFGAAFIIGGAVSLIAVFRPAAHWPMGPGLFMAVFLIGLGTLAWLDTMRTLVTVDQHAVSVVRLFRSRSTPLQDIDGYRLGDKDRFFIIAKNHRSMELPLYLERRKELITWVKEKYEDVDKRERVKETEVLLENEQFGLTKEDREARLTSAKTIETISFGAGVALILWALFYPQPFETMMTIILLMPWIAVFITWYYKGLMKLYKKKSSPYPSTMPLMLMGVFGSMVEVLRSYDLYGFGQHAWSLLIGGTILSAAICIVACQQAITTAGKKGLTYACILVMAGLYSYSLLVYSNCHYDRSIPTIYPVEITARRVSHGKSNSYYVSLSPWGRYTDGNEVSVSKRFYDLVNTHDSIRVFLKKGKWDIGWYKLVYTPPRD